MKRAISVRAYCGVIASPSITGLIVFRSTSIEKAPCCASRTQRTVADPESADAIEVIGVSERSASAEAGVRAGDLIVAVEGQSIREYTLGVFD